MFRLKAAVTTAIKCSASSIKYLHLSSYNNKDIKGFSTIRPKMHDLVGKRPFTVCIEGNIGCGKTTLLNYFCQFPEVEVFHEPVKKWTNLNNHNLMDLMYKDPTRWSHLFQTYVQLTMMEQHLQPSYKSTKILERSLYSARFCFVENLYRSGKMSDPEYQVYCEWFDMISSLMDCKVDLIVYLRTDPTLLHDRIKMRNRSEEQHIPLEYLQSLHDLHDEWLFDSAMKNHTPVLVMDANGSLPQMEELYKKHMKEIVRASSLPVIKIHSSPNKKERKSHLICTQAAAAN